MVGKAWPPGRLHKCSHLVRSRAGAPRGFGWRVLTEGIGPCAREGLVRVGVSCRVPRTGLGGEELAWTGGPCWKPRGAGGRGPGLPAGSTA